MSIPSFPLDPLRATQLTDARLQVHHAAQLLVAAGISYLPHEPDDSHTNLEWLAASGSLASRVVPTTKPFRLALRVADLLLQVLDDHDVADASLPLTGETIAAGAAWIRAQVADRGVDATRFTLDKHYSIPAHALDTGAAFNGADGGAFDQLARWFGSANDVLQAARAAHGGAEVRCWPHHFDIATLLEERTGTTIGIGMEPGDASYDEPYYYVNLNPQPVPTPTSQLAGGGAWHARAWFGAVLTGSRLVAGGGQREQILAFIESAIGAYRRPAS